MDRRDAKSWYIGTGHVLTSYIAAGVFSFALIFIVAFIMVVLNLNTDTASIYIPLISSLVVLPLALFPATRYSARFIMGRYKIENREAVLKYALVALIVFKLFVDWIAFSFFQVADIISFLLSLTVFYNVSIKYVQNNQFSDMIQIKETTVKA